MGVFTIDNPISVLLAGVVIFLVLKVVLSKALGKTEFGQKHSDLVSALIVIVGLLLITSIPFLRMVARTLPFITLVFMVVILGTLIFLAMGVKGEKIPSGLKNVGRHTYMTILIFLIIAWGASMIWGQGLLEKNDSSAGNVPITGFAGTEDKEATDFTFIFTKPLLGFVLIFLVLGFAFNTITKITA